MLSIRYSNSWDQIVLFDSTNNFQKLNYSVFGPYFLVGPTLVCTFFPLSFNNVAALSKVRKWHRESWKASCTNRYFCTTFIKINSFHKWRSKFKFSILVEDHIINITAIIMYQSCWLKVNIKLLFITFYHEMK